MKPILGALSLGALLVGYSTISQACDYGCNLKPETPAAFDVACMGNDGCKDITSPPSSGNGQLKPDKSFELACDEGGCNKDLGSDSSNGNGQFKEERSMKLACEQGSCDHRPEPMKPFRTASCVTSDC